MIWIVTSLLIMKIGFIIYFYNRFYQHLRREQSNEEYDPTEEFYNIIPALNQISDLNRRRVRKQELIDLLFEQQEKILYKDYVEIFKIESARKIEEEAA